jgi:hypothetical protein
LKSWFHFSTRTTFQQVQTAPNNLLNLNFASTLEIQFYGRLEPRFAVFTVVVHDFKPWLENQDSLSHPNSIVYNLVMEIALSKDALRRIEKLQSSLKTSQADVIEQALVELERRADNFRAILEDDAVNHDLSEEDGLMLALEAQRAVRDARG